MRSASTWAMSSEKRRQYHCKGGEGATPIQEDAGQVRWERYAKALKTGRRSPASGATGVLAPTPTRAAGGSSGPGRGFAIKMAAELLPTQCAKTFPDLSASGHRDGTGDCTSGHGAHDRRWRPSPSKRLASSPKCPHVAQVTPVYGCIGPWISASGSVYSIRPSAMLPPPRGPLARCAPYMAC